MSEEAKVPEAAVKPEPKPAVKPPVAKEAAKKAVAAVKESMPKPKKKAGKPALGKPKKAAKKAAKKITRKTKKATKAPSKPTPKRAKKASKKAPKPGRRLGRRGVGAAKRTRVVEKFRALIDAGASRQEAAKQVKFADLTLRRWEAAMGLKPASSRGKGGGKKAKVTKARKPGRPKGKVAKKRGRPRGQPASKPVGRPRGRPRKARPADEHPAGGLVVVSPSGLRLEGIQLGDLLMVLRALK
ncbi:MAG TPA: hypothetical protein PK668_13130 [Myxococcota bacterium]|nr:hypothetical protein [Myxococcota bacterium]HRY93588.1 hypothetical protein [Myxococcota bacterium]